MVLFYVSILIRRSRENCIQNLNSEDDYIDTLTLLKKGKISQKVSKNKFFLVICLILSSLSCYLVLIHITKFLISFICTCCS